MPYGNTRGKWKGHNNNGYPFIYWDWTKFFWTQTYIERIAEQTEVFDPGKPVWHGTQVHQKSTKYLQSQHREWFWEGNISLSKKDVKYKYIVIFTETILHKECHNILWSGYYHDAQSVIKWRYVSHGHNSRGFGQWMPDQLRPPYVQPILLQLNNISVGAIKTASL